MLPEYRHHFLNSNSMERENLKNQQHRRRQMRSVVAGDADFETTQVDRREENLILFLALADEK